jgi:hypothetical protein
MGDLLVYIYFSKQRVLLLIRYRSTRKSKIPQGLNNHTPNPIHTALLCLNRKSCKYKVYRSLLQISGLFISNMPRSVDLKFLPVRNKVCKSNEGK